MIADACRQAWRMLDRLREDTLFDEIRRAVARYPELRFSLIRL